MIAVSALDTELAAIAERLSVLPQRNIAAFFAACGERFFEPYAEFSVATGFGNPRQLRSLLDQAWNSLITAQPAADWKDALRLLEEDHTPHSDDFGTLECLFAQDAVGCIDACIRSLLNAPDPRWVEIPFEAIRAAVSDELTGFIDLGDSPDRPAFENRLIRDRRVTKELAAQYEDLSSLEGDSMLGEQTIASIRNRAVENRWTTSALLGTSSEK